VDALVYSSLEDEVLVSWHDLLTLGALPKGWPNFVRSMKMDATKLEAIKKEFFLNHQYLFTFSPASPPRIIIIHIHRMQDNIEI